MCGRGYGRGVAVVRAGEGVGCGAPKRVCLRRSKENDTAQQRNGFPERDEVRVVSERERGKGKETGWRLYRNANAAVEPMDRAIKRGSRAIPATA